MIVGVLRVPCSRVISVVVAGLLLVCLGIVALPGSAHASPGATSSTGVTTAHAAALSTEAAELPASGEWGTCKWDIDTRGTLTVHPGVGQSYGVPSYCSYASVIKKVVVAAESGLKVYAPADCSQLVFALFWNENRQCTVGLDSFPVNFNSCVKEMDLSGLSTSAVTNMNEMFTQNSELASLDLSSFDTANVTSMSDMFRNCYSLASLDLSSFDTSNVATMEGMFAGCENLSKLKLGPKTRLLADCGLDAMVRSAGGGLIETKWRLQGSSLAYTSAELIAHAGTIDTAGTWKRDLQYDNPITAKAAKKSFKVQAKALEKRAMKITGAVVVDKAQGKVTFANASKGKTLKAFKVAKKTGAITVPKKTSPGTYKVAVSVSAAGNGNFKPGSKTATVKVVVK